MRVGIAGILLVLRRCAPEVVPGSDGPGFKGPIETARVIQSHLQTFGAHRGGEITHQVALGRERNVRAFGIRHAAGPKAKTVVMLAGEQHVARAGLVEQPRPFGRFPFLHVFVEHRREIVVVEIRALGFDVMFVGG